VVGTHGSPSSLKSAAPGPNHATWKQLQRYETGVVDKKRVFRKLHRDGPV